MTEPGKVVYRIVGWAEMYEVSRCDRAWQPGQPKREGRLRYFRARVHGRSRGEGWTKLLALAGPKRAMEVFGVFMKCVEIAGDQPDKRRDGTLADGSGTPLNVNDIAFFLGVDTGCITRSMEVLTDKRLNWVSANVCERSQKTASETETETETETENTMRPAFAGELGASGKDLTKLPEGFARFWDAWPDHFRKGGRGRCLDIWRRKRLEPHVEEVLAALEAAKTCPQWTKDAGQFVPAPPNWLKKAPWEGASRNTGSQPPHGGVVLPPKSKYDP